MHGAASRIHAGNENFLDFKIVEADRCSHDVDDGIDSTDLVEMHVLWPHTVHLSLRLRENAEDLEAHLLDFRRKRRALQDCAHIMHRTMVMLMTMFMCRHSSFICMSVVMLAAMFMRMVVSFPMLATMPMRCAQKFDVDIRRGNAVLLHGTGLQTKLFRHRQAAQLDFQRFQRHARRKERAEQHVAAQS